MLNTALYSTAIYWESFVMGIPTGITLYIEMTPGPLLNLKTVFLIFIRRIHIPTRRHFIWSLPPVWQSMYATFKSHVADGIFTCRLLKQFWNWLKFHCSALSRVQLPIWHCRAQVMVWRRSCATTLPEPTVNKFIGVRLGRTDMLNENICKILSVVPYRDDIISFSTTSAYDIRPWQPMI